MKRFLLAVVTGAVTAFSGGTYAGPIIDFTAGVMQNVVNNATYGYSFSTTSSITIGGLGVIESFRRGIGSAHDVGVWNAGGVLLASASVSNSDAAVASTSPLGQWRVASIADLVLDPGTYYAGVYYPVNSEDVLVAATPGSIVGVNYLSAQYDLGGALAFPGTSFVNALVGPALFLAQVPEPATLALLGVALAGLGFARRRKLH